MTILYSNGLMLDTQRKILSIDGQSVNIAPLTLDVLVQLVTHAPETLSINQLIEHCWQNKVVSDETVVQRIALIRKLLTDNNIHDKCVENRRGEGYRWLPEVSLSEDSFSKDSLSKVNMQVPSENTNVNRKVTKSTFIKIMVFCLMISGFSTVFFLHSDKNKHQNFTSESNELLSQAHLYRTRFDKESNKHAIQLYQKILLHEPSNVSALAGISMSYSHAVSKFGGSPELLSDAVEQAGKALNIAPENAFVLRAFGLAADVRGHINTAIRYYEQALAIDPTHVSVYGDIAYLLTVKGRLGDAFHYQLTAMSGKQQFRQTQMALLLYLLGDNNRADYWFNKAVLLNPHNNTDKRMYLEFLIKASRFSEVEQQLAKNTAMQQRDPGIAVIYGIALAMQNRVKEAMKVFQTVEGSGITQLESLIWQSYLLDDVVNPDLQEELMAQIEQTGSVWPSTYVLMAMHNRLKGQNEKSLNYLKLALDSGYRESQWLQMLPMLKELHQTSGFKAVIAEMSELVAQQQLILEDSTEYQQFMNQRIY